jgi:RHS repeat-associated protein
MPERSYTATTKGYRFAFNGKEQDNQVQGNGNAYDFGARIYDSRLGRFLSVDFYSNKYPFMSPYSFCLDNPIIFLDNNGDSIRGFKKMLMSMASGSVSQVLNLSSTFKQWYGTMDRNKDVKVLYRPVAYNDYKKMEKGLQGYTEVKFKLENGKSMSADKYDNSKHGKVLYPYVDVRIRAHQTMENGKIAAEAVALDIETILHESFVHTDVMASMILKSTNADGTFNVQTFLDDYKSHYDETTSANDHVTFANGEVILYNKAGSEIADKLTNHPVGNQSTSMDKELKNGKKGKMKVHEFFKKLIKSEPKSYYKDTGNKKPEMGQDNIPDYEKG